MYMGTKWVHGYKMGTWVQNGYMGTKSIGGGDDGGTCFPPPNIFGGGDSYGSVPPNNFPRHIYFMGHWLLHAPVLYALEYTKSSTHFQKFPRMHKRHGVQSFQHHHCNTWLITIEI